MAYTPNANWTAEKDAADQRPVYYVAIDGLTAQYSTHPVSGASPAKTVLMEPPTGGGVSVDIIEGRQTVQTVEFELIDVGDAITDMISTQAAGAPVGTLINRKATIYSGSRLLAASDYAAMFTGRITGVRMNGTLTGYIFRISSLDYLLDGTLMTAATAALPSTVRGNVVNVFWSLVTGTFDTGHADFPLDFVSTTTGSTSAPTGLGVSSALLNTVQLKAERDAWHPEDVVNVQWTAPVNARSEFEDELFRALQCFPVISGDGLLGLKFHVPALPPADAPVVDSDTIISVDSWERQLGDHLNKFTINGDWNNVTEVFGNVLYPLTGEPTEDTDDQAASEETIHYEVNSKWLKSAYNGEEIALELAGRMRVRYLHTPALIRLTVNARQQHLERGDVVAVTHPELPDLFTGTRGITSKLMTVISIEPEWSRGVFRLSLLDTGYRRYGVIAPAGKSSTYTGATTQSQNTFAYIADVSGLMSDGSEGYRLI